MTDLDLSTAVFPGDPYGEYSDGHIVTLSGGYPCFYFTGATLDRTLTYTFTVTYDPDDVRDSGGRYIQLGVLDDADPETDYADDSWTVLHDETPSADSFTFVVYPALWASAPSGSNTMLFCSDPGGALLSLSYVEGGTPPTTFVNRDNGLDLAGPAPSRWVPAVAPTPARLQGFVAFDKARVYTAVTNTPPRQVAFTDPVVVMAPRHTTRIFVGGVDVTSFRGVRTPCPDYTLIEPLMYGSGTLYLPQVNAMFERFGEGDLSFLKKFAPVVVQRYDADDNPVAGTPDYVSFIASLETDGPECHLPLAGQAAGRLSADDYWPPAVFKRAQDAGFLLIDLLLSHGVSAKPKAGPVTGTHLTRRGGGNALDEFSNVINVLSALGPRQTVMPNHNLIYRLHDKDLETVDATVYFDGELATQTLSSSALEEPDVVFATGRTKRGELVNFAAAPGATQGDPPDFPNDAPFGPGTTDADTTSGDGVSVAQQQLAAVLQALSIEDVNLGTYDEATADAVQDLQERAGLLIAPELIGWMTSATWDALWNVGVVGFSLDQARILPAAQRGYVPKWNLSANGSKLGRNRNYVPASQRPRVVVGIDVGTGFNRHRTKRYAHGSLAPRNVTNWAGTASLVSGLIAGDHTPGDAVTSADVMPARALRPGMNISAPKWDGGTLFHVSGVNVSDDGTKVEPILDTQARDSVAAWEAIQERRDSRKDPARLWSGAVRTSTMRQDNLNDWTDICGVLANKVPATGGEWTEFPIFSGQTGVLQKVKAVVSPAEEFAMIVAGRPFHLKRLNARVPDPLGEPPAQPQRHRIAFSGSPTGGTYTLDGNSNTTSAIALHASAGTVQSAVRGLGGSFATARVSASDGAYIVTMGFPDSLSVGANSLTGGSSPSVSVTTSGPSAGDDRPWYEQEALSKYLEDHNVLYGAGTFKNPCGYGSSVKTDAETTLPTGSPITGIHRDFGGGDYETTSGFALWVYIWVPSDTVVQPGRMLWQQLTAGA